MIASLRGTITQKTSDALVVEVGGLGYEVLVASADEVTDRVGEETTLLIHEHLREDAHTLYGFRRAESKRLFELLLSVNGVGPKVAMAMLAATTLEQLQTAIATGDPNVLRGVAGVGQKTAQRVMLELRGKLEPGAEATSTDSTYQALIALGYSSAQASGALAELPTEVTGEQERIKLALKGLAK